MVKLLNHLIFIWQGLYNQLNAGTVHRTVLSQMCVTKKKTATETVAVFFLAGAEGLEPSARGFGAKSTLSVKPRVKIQSL